jgi:predicted site-specific integrase-resolvase
MDAEPLRAAIYTRVSTEDQAKEGFSLDAQLDKLRSYCKARDWDIGGEYIDDGYSGRNVKRPEYSRMMEEMDKWDLLLVIKMDRIHRNSKNFMLMMEYLSKKEKEFASMSESFDTSTAMGRFVMNIVQGIAQLESEQIGERVYIGMEQKAKKNCGVLVYFCYKDGKSMGEIAKMFNNAKIPTKKQGFWAKKTISTILKNPTYCGYLHWEKYLHKSDHIPIISETDFNEVQDRIVDHGGKPSKKLEN